MLNLLPVDSLIIVWYQSCYGAIISRFDSGIGGVNGVIMGEEGVEDGAKDTPL